MMDYHSMPRIWHGVAPGPNFRRQLTDLAISSTVLSTDKLKFKGPRDPSVVI